MTYFNNKDKIICIIIKRISLHRRSIFIQSTAEYAFMFKKLVSCSVYVQFTNPKHLSLNG